MIERLNTADRAAFTSALGHLFEHSPWVAEETWSRRPFRDAAHLHTELCATMHRAAQEKQLALISAHPDLAGRLAQQRKLTDASAAEQAHAGLSKLTEAELGEFQRMNEAYRGKFGFPFIVCARLNDKAAILAAMKTRLGHDVETEFATALAEIEKIARLRLDDVLKSG